MNEYITDNIYECAKRFREIGLNVLPLFNYTKVPFDKKRGWHEFKERRLIDAEFHQWFSRPDLTGVALVTGPTSGILVVDHDCYHGQTELKLETPTISITTNSGKHFFFRHTQDISSRLDNTNHIEVRTNGLLAVLPPSHVYKKDKEGKLTNEIGTYKFEGSPKFTDLPILDLSLLPSVSKQNDKVNLAEVPQKGSRHNTLLSVANSTFLRFAPHEWILGEDFIRYKAEHSNPPYTDVHEQNDVEQIIKDAKDFAIQKKQNVQLKPRIKEEAFYGLVGEIVKTIAPHTESDPVALLLNFLTAFGSIIGEKPYFRVERTKHHMRLFGVIVGDSANARKGTSWDQIKNIFCAIDEGWKRNLQSGMSSGEGLIWSVRDQIVEKKPVKTDGHIVDYENVITDHGITDKRSLIIESEFASVLKVLSREGNTLSPLIRKAWDDGDLQILTKNSPARATNAHISILAHITPEELLKHLNETEMANGFGNRFIWVLVQRSKKLPFGGNISEIDFAPLVKKVHQTIENAKVCEEITWAEETKPFWEVAYETLSEGKPGLIGSMTSRAAPQVVRLSSLYALLDTSSTIRPAHLKAALALWQYAENSARYIFGNKTGNSVADKILDFLKNRQEGVSKTEINELFGGHRAPTQIDNALSLLETLGSIDKKVIETSGRNKEIYSLLNPHIPLNPHIEKDIASEGKATDSKENVISDGGKSEISGLSQNEPTETNIEEDWNL
jgi:hypothetical protein